MARAPSSRTAEKAAPAGPGIPVQLVCGDDDYSVKQRGREIYEKWTAELGGMDHEMIDAAVQNSGDALKALSKLREALQTLPFFGGGKVVWFQNCNFLGEERTASSAAVVESLADLGTELGTLQATSLRLLITAGKPDRRRSFFKALEGWGVVESFQTLSADDRDWAMAAETHVVRQLASWKKSIDDDALGELVVRTGPNLRALSNEVDKLATFAGERMEIHLADVRSLTTVQKQARAFALAEALGDRNLPVLLRTLDQELWEMRTDKAKSEIGILYGLITKIRTILFLRELKGRGILKPARDYNSFKAQLAQLPASDLPQDKKLNPMAGHPFTLFNAMKQVDNYDSTELVNAMEILLETNRKLVSSSLDGGMVLQQALLRIIGKGRTKTAR